MNTSKKILIIEDDANILYGLQAKLSIEGFKIITNNGMDSEEEIIKQIKSINPDLIIQDLILPKTDGFSILKIIKSDSETVNIPIFIFTNLSDADSRSRGVNLGADQYIIKDNISIDEFVIKIKKIFENKEKLK